MKKFTVLMATFVLAFLYFNANAQQSTLWTETFEGDWTQNWGVDNGTWEVGVPTSGPNVTHSGQQCAATVLNGNYSDDAPDSRLIRFTGLTVRSVGKPM